MKLFRAVLITILIVSAYALSYSAHAEGLSYIGMCNKTWDCNNTLKQWNGEPFGWLENSFGSKCECVNRLLSTDMDKVVRVHILNGPCMRNKRCGRYEVFYGYTPASASRAIIRGDGKLIAKIETLLKRLKSRLDNASGKVTCYVSPCLECDLNERARRTLANLVFAYLPNCYFVDNPYKYSCIRGAICEKHGASPSVAWPCIVDLDGTDGSTIDIQKWLAKYSYCNLRFIWYPWMNCIGSKFIDPRKRNCI